MPCGADCLLYIFYFQCPPNILHIYYNTLLDSILQSFQQPNKNLSAIWVVSCDLPSIVMPSSVFTGIDSITSPPLVIWHFPSLIPTTAPFSLIYKLLIHLPLAIQFSKYIFHGYLINILNTIK